MPTAFSHPAVAIGLLPLFREVLQYRSLLMLGIVLTVLPDIDVVGFRYGIPYADMFGHRGLSHSLPVAFSLSAVISMSVYRFYTCSFWRIWCYLFLCMASHGLLDAMTSGGLGVAFFSPFSNERFFFDFRPIRVSTLNISRFFNGQGLPVILSELKWIWLPVFLLLSFSSVIMVVKRFRLKTSE